MIRLSLEVILWQINFPSLLIWYHVLSLDSMLQNQGAYHNTLTKYYYVNLTFFLCLAKIMFILYILYKPFFSFDEHCGFQLAVFVLLYFYYNINKHFKLKTFNFISQCIFHNIYIEISSFIIRNPMVSI